MVNSTYDGCITCNWKEGSACRALARFKKEQIKNSEQRKISVSFRSQFFPGARIRWKGEKCEGTVNLFNNGKYVIVGVKKEERAQILYHQLCAIMKTYWTTLNEPTSCVWTADSSSIALSDTTITADNDM